MVDILKWFGILAPSITYLFFILREIKEIFFDKDSSGDSFITNIKYIFLPGTRKREKNEYHSLHEPPNVKYSDCERQLIISELLVHNFFISVNNIKNNIPNMEFGHPKKGIILKDVIKIYVETIENHSADFLKRNKLDELNTQQLNQLLLEEIPKIEYEIYSKMRNRLGDSLYYLLIDHPYKGFKVKNSIFKEIFISGVLTLSSQSMAVYKYDNYKRISEMLTSMYISLQTIVKTFEKVFKDYNGDLDKFLD